MKADIHLNCVKKTSIPSSWRTDFISTAKTNWLVLCGEMVLRVSTIKSHTNTLCEHGAELLTLQHVVMSGLQ